MTGYKVLIVHRSTYGTEALAAKLLLDRLMEPHLQASHNPMEIVIDLFDYIQGEILQKQLFEQVEKASCIVCLWTANLFEGGGVAKELIGRPATTPLFVIKEESVSEVDLPPSVWNILKPTWKLGQASSLREALSTIYFNGIKPDIIKRFGPQESARGHRYGRPHQRTVVHLRDLNPSSIRSELLAREIIEQVLHFCDVHSFNPSKSTAYLELLSEKMIPSVNLLQCPTVYYPDDWSYALVLAIFLNPDLVKNKIVGEIGCGCGIIPIYADKLGIQFTNYVGFDIDYLAGRVCELNFSLKGSIKSWQIISGGYLFEFEKQISFLAEKQNFEHYLDVVIANVPQVPVLGPRNHFEATDYYYFNQSLQDFDRQAAKMGLQLVMEVLRAAKTRLRNGGQVIMTISGRSDEKFIKDAFDECGFKATNIFKTIIRHDARTDLSAFQFFHGSDPSKYQYKFYNSRDRRRELSIVEAVRLSQRGIEVYHDLYVFSAISSDTNPD